MQTHGLRRFYRCVFIYFMDSKQSTDIVVSHSNLHLIHLIDSLRFGKFISENNAHNYRREELFECTTITENVSHQMRNVMWTHWRLIHFEWVGNWTAMEIVGQMNICMKWNEIMIFLCNKFKFEFEITYFQICHCIE